MRIPDLDAGYWQHRYDDGSDGWDIGAPSTPLATYIDQLTDKHFRILIPGCGRAWEGRYMHELGFRNVWLMDLTGKPFEEFLQRCPDFPKAHLLIGDFFAHEGQYDLIIEQTFFCAIDPALRERYAEKISALLAAGGELVGVLFDDPQPGKVHGAPPFGGSRAEYIELFSKHFERVSLEPCYNSIAPRAGREVWISIGDPIIYRPIACSLHDQYLAWSTLGQRVDVLYAREDGSTGTTTGRITDVFTAAGTRAEWMVLDSGERVRLDRIIQARAV